MKHKGSSFQYKEQFEQDILQNYRRIRKDHLNRYGRISRSLLMHELVNSPAQRFYTSEEQATRIIRRMLYHHDKFPKMKPLTREMYLEIYSRIKARLKRKRNQPIQPLVEKIISEPAPKFYITPNSAETILCRLKKNHRHYVHSGKYQQRGTPDLHVSGSPSSCSSSTSSDQNH